MAHASAHGSHEHSHDDEHGDDYHHHAHISTIKTNTLVFIGLIILTLLTVGAYTVRLGEYNLLVALIIASMKASLVCTWFMHLKYEQRFNTLFFLGAFLFVAVFVGYTVNDTGYRGADQSVMGVRVDPSTGNYAYGTATTIGDNNGAYEMLPAVSEGEPTEEADGEAEAEPEGE